MHRSSSPAGALGRAVPGLGPWAAALYEHHASLGSTNDRAKALARLGAPEGTLVRADEQTAGRGRRGKTWQSPPGLGLWCSFVLRPAISLGRWPRLVGWASLAVLDVVEQFSAGCAGVKWPNDVLVEGKKIAGILLEADAGARGGPFAVLGVGLNVNQRTEDFAPEWRAEATSLRMEGRELKDGGPLDREEVFAALVRRLEATYAREAAEGFARVSERLKRRSLTLGRPVRVAGEGEAFSGVAVDIIPDGSLVVVDEAGRRRVVHAGEVSIRTR